MHFENEDYYIDLVNDNDLVNIVELYNSNKNFLINHIGMESITITWLINELNIMKKEGFYSCKIIQKSTKDIIGLIDFKIGKETYLSLLMLNGYYRGNGKGKEIFSLLENYIKSKNSSTIRIDVVTNYDENVLNFWSKNGFTITEKITLNWNNKELPAVIMKKILD